MNQMYFSSIIFMETMIIEVYAIYKLCMKHNDCAFYPVAICVTILEWFKTAHGH